MNKEKDRRANGFAISRDLSPKLTPLDQLNPLGREVRKHPPQQIKKLARSLEEFGFVIPIVVDEQRRVVAGWALVAAARRLGMKEIPAVTIRDLSEAQLRALRLALNRLSEDASSDLKELALELDELMKLEPDIDLSLTGFETGEIEVLLVDDVSDEEDGVPDLEDAEATARPGDLFQLGDHRILCADATRAESYQQLMDQERAGMLLADPPYNLAILGNVSGLGSVRHQNFQMASGEMSPEAFSVFLKNSLGLAARYSVKGAVHCVFMDWRHQREILSTVPEIYTELLNLCVWIKSNAGMGSLYRSQHELVFVFKVGKAPHINNVQLGRHGRHRSNVWSYASPNLFSSPRKSKLSLHPTVKPLALVADAIRDCSHRGGLILDPFGGSGTTLIAAEKTGRKARLIEIEPRFVDVTIARWQRLTGKDVVLVSRRAALE